MSRNFKIFILAVIILFFVAGNGYLIYSYFQIRTELNQTKAVLASYDNNDKVIAFNKLFIAKVLKSDQEVDFETRLQLENSLRSLNDQEIMDQWQKFVASKTEVDAQIQVKNLLELLANKAGS